MVKIYDRENKEYYIEKQYGEKELNFLYNTRAGRLLLKIAVSKGFSELERYRKDSRRSISQIQPFIDKYHINCDDFEKKDYTSFNDFFTRCLAPGRRKICLSNDRIIAPADSKLLVYPISDGLQINVKHSCYSVGRLLRDEKTAKLFAGGMCFVYRLTVDDYHRYCFCENGKITMRRHIDGVLHTVSSLSESVDVYTENCREYCVISTDHLGDVIQMEVGAMLVGRIVNSDSEIAVRGDEKGFFSYGGSTVIVLYSRGQVSAHDDIIEHSQKHIETKVKYGEAVGRILC